MSNFTYEIDERNLRFKMKEFMVPVTESAWQQFEAFSESLNSQKGDHAMKFNFNLNRSIVLPSVFGVVIILFSFLLVNFISIKNPVRESSPKVEAVQQPAPQSPETENAVPAAVAEKKPEQPVATASLAEAARPQERPVTVMPEPKPESLAIQAIPAAEVITDSASEEAKAKRQAERRAARAEAKKLEEIKPTPVAEESSSDEVRPD